MKHENNGHCVKCLAIFDTFPGFHEGLKDWFLDIQRDNPEAHISCAGRGHIDQETCFQRGASKAHYGQSAHNFNVAIDIFQLTEDGKAAWPKPWFTNVIAPAVAKQNMKPDPSFCINWYGRPKAPFYELPHCEVTNWKSLGLPLVE